MHFIGVDLAWGLGSPPGWRCSTTTRALLHVSAVRTDDEIEAELAAVRRAATASSRSTRRWWCKNATGSRPAEKALSSDFRRFDAGTHPSNTGKPEFADGTRGPPGWPSSSASTSTRARAGARRAIEVYPHAATIVLFGLSKILRYKNKPGRDLDAAARPSCWC